jgi:hypothetical protein
MDFYQFAVTNFRISHTRALHEDSLHLSHASYAGGDVIASSLVSLGDFNNGDYDPQNYVHPDLASSSASGNWSRRPRPRGPYGPAHGAGRDSSWAYSPGA